MKNVKITLLIVIFFSILIVSSQNCSNSLSSLDKQDINENPPPSKLENESLFKKARLGNRLFISSLLTELFISQQGNNLSQEDVITLAGEDSRNLADYITDDFIDEDKLILNIIIEHMLNKIDEFYGSCSFVESDSTCADRGDMTNRQFQTRFGGIANSSVTREGHRISVCNLLTENDRALQNAILNLTGSRTTNFKVEYIQDVFNAFYPNNTIDESVKVALEDIILLMQENAETSETMWKGVLTPICLSAGWQVN